MSRGFLAVLAGGAKRVSVILSEAKDLLLFRYGRRNVNFVFVL